MVKKPVILDGLLNTDVKPIDTGIPQRGTEPNPPTTKLAPKKREGEKRLTLALDGETYRRLRMHAATTDETHQDILERALAEYLKRANA
ncbi:CopG family transcriptional regulator [Paracoccus sp. (in: a-proteobacteria)]|uniref:CopG family transcriptional regulator n=1 Tax=Paracoccus sp. TaxID=267 RepID=UPI00289A8B53|nr:CopG family transcriptional regulator [Paracoccus sp. (in: a-proteobacteria)]